MFWIKVAEVSLLGTPGPAGQCMPPPPGVACRAKHGIAGNRVKRGAAAAVRSVPLPPWAEAYNPCARARRATSPGNAMRRRQRCRGVPPLAHILSAHFPATGRPTRPSSAASMKHHQRLHMKHHLRLHGSSLNITSLPVLQPLIRS